MKLHVLLTSATGEKWEGNVILAPRPGVSAQKKVEAKGAPSAPHPRSVAIDLNLPLRPFLKTYARGKSGAAKLTLLVAYLVRGKTGATIDSGKLQETWNRATAFLGTYNRAHATRAKDSGWLDSSKHGEYVLQATWSQAAD